MIGRMMEAGVMSGMLQNPKMTMRGFGMEVNDGGISFDRTGFG